MTNNHEQLTFSNFFYQLLDSKNFMIFHFFEKNELLLSKKDFRLTKSDKRATKINFPFGFPIN